MHGTTRTAALVPLILALATGCAGSSKRGTKTLAIMPGTHHVGDDYMQAYPEAAKAEGIHVSTAFEIEKRPRSARLVLEAADVDLDGCEIWLNNKCLGQFTIAREWHTDAFEIPRALLREGHNDLLIRSKVWSSTQAEDFFFRNAQLVLEY